MNHTIPSEGTVQMKHNTPAKKIQVTTMHKSKPTNKQRVDACHASYEKGKASNLWHTKETWVAEALALSLSISIFTMRSMRPLPCMPYMWRNKKYSLSPIDGLIRIVLSNTQVWTNATRLIQYLSKMGAQVATCDIQESSSKCLQRHNCKHEGRCY